MVDLERFRTTDGFHEHRNYLFVNWDEYKIGRNKDLIGTDSVASCLAITLYDPQKKIGALAHISGLSRTAEELKPEKVIDTLLHGLHTLGSSDPKELEATLSGEGTVSNENQRNSPIVRAKLNQLGIKIIGEDLCKAPGRLVFLHCDTGMVEVYRA